MGCPAVLLINSPSILFLYASPSFWTFILALLLLSVFYIFHLHSSGVPCCVRCCVSIETLTDAGTRFLWPSLLNFMFQRTIDHHITAQRARAILARRVSWKLAFNTWCKLFKLYFPPYSPFGVVCTHLFSLSPTMVLLKLELEGKKVTSLASFTHTCKCRWFHLPNNDVFLQRRGRFDQIALLS